MNEKIKIMQNMLELSSVESRWDDLILKEASKASGYPKEFGGLLFPNQAIEVFVFLHNYLDESMGKEFTTLLESQEVGKNGSKIKLTEKIQKLLDIRFSLCMEHKIGVLAAFRFAMLRHLIEFNKVLYTTVDRIWELCNDSSLDFTYYTKRLTLLGIYKATLLYWAQDESSNFQETSEFLSRRLDEVIRFGKFKRDLMAKFQKW